MTGPFGDWPLLDRVRLRQCELRLRNNDALRVTNQQTVKDFGEQHGRVDWTTLRPLATEILVNVETLLTEYRAIIVDVEDAFIPMSEYEGEMRRRAVVQHARAALELVGPMLPAISSVIEQEDAKLTSSSRPSSTSE